MAAKAKAKKNAGGVSEWLASIGWTLDHEDAGSDGDAAGVGRREASYSARKNSTNFDVTMPSVERLLAAVEEYEKVSRPA